MTRETAQALLLEIVQTLDYEMLYEDMYLFTTRWSAIKVEEATDVIMEYVPGDDN